MKIDWFQFFQKVRQSHEKTEKNRLRLPWYVVPLALIFLIDILFLLIVSFL